MREEKESTIGVKIEEQPESRFDLLRLTIPLPRFMFLPKETRDHLRAARRERLLALRSLFDVAIQRLEDSEEKLPRKAEKIKVD
jgi:hypothetical protein